MSNEVGVRCCIETTELSFELVPYEELLPIYNVLLDFIEVYQIGDVFYGSLSFYR